jgi:hypothetical protein
VLRHGVRGLRRGRKQPYVTMTIPESVARKVYQRKTRLDEK